MTIKQFIERAIEGGWEPYRYHFIEAESIAEDKVAGPAPKPYLIEVGMDGSEEFECVHPIVVMRWNEESDPRVNWENSVLGFALAGIYLDPEAWKAVGKVEGWKEWYYGWFVNKPHGGEWKWVEHKDGTVHWGGAPNEAPNIVTHQDGWKYHMHRMIDALNEGKTIEEFLETL